MDIALQASTQAIFVLVALLALVDYARHGERRRLDAALMLSALAAIIAIQWFVSLSRLQVRWLSTAGAVALMAHPYLLLRLVDQFRPVGAPVRWMALAGLVLSVLLLVVFTTPFPAGVTLVLIAYFAAVEGYAGGALALGAMTSSGGRRRQVGLAASGSGLLALVIALAGVTAVVPAAAAVVTPLSRVLAAAAAVCYYAGFAPPGWIRESWRGLQLGAQVVPVVVTATLVTALGTTSAIVWQLQRAWAGRSTPADTLSGPLTEAAYRAGVFGLCLVVLLAAGAALLAGRLFRPLRALTAAAARFSEGNYEVRVTVEGAADLRALAAQFNAMAQAVGEHATALQAQRVAAERFAAGRQALLDLVRAIAVDASVADVAARVVAHLDTVLHATTWGVLVPAADGGLEVVAAGGPGAAQRRGVRLPPGAGITGRAFRSGTVVLVDDVRADPDYVPVLSDTAIRAELAVPLRHGEGVLGVLNLESTDAGAFGPPDAALAQIVAGHVALALARARLREELQQRNAALEAASRHKSEFLASMSHELRTPLNAINGFSQLLLVASGDEYDQDTRRAYLQTIRDSGEHLLQLINDILDLSKIEAGRMELHLTRVDLPSLISRVLATVQPLADRKHLLLSSDAEAGAPQTVEADEGKLKQVLYNLLSNAIKFTPEHGAVAVLVRPHPDGVQLTVADTGIGIALEDQERIFEEFQQVDMGVDRRYEGTGLGLALTRRLAELHAGRVWVESVPREGSQFHVLLPRGIGVTPSSQEHAVVRQVPAPTPENSTAGTTSAPSGQAGSSASGTGPLVLVVEDDPRSAQLLAAYLQRGRYQTAIARDGHDALRLARVRQPVAVTLDIMLPELDGWEVLRALKSDPAIRDIPVVIVSVVDEQELGYALGATDYLVKPVDGESLLACLQRHALTTTVTERDVRVLVVDDDPAAVELLSGFLTPAGFSVLRADGGADGIARARTDRPDLLLLDLMMPDVSGFDVVAALKGEPATRDIPIVVVTAKDLTDEDKRRLNGQVATVLGKGSLIGEDLLGWLDRLLGRETTLLRRTGAARDGPVGRSDTTAAPPASAPSSAAVGS